MNGYHPTQERFARLYPVPRVGINHDHVASVESVVDAGHLNCHSSFDHHIYFCPELVIVMILRRAMIKVRNFSILGFLDLTLFANLGRRPCAVYGLLFLWFVNFSYQYFSRASRAFRKGEVLVDR